MMNLVWFRSDLRVDDNPALFHAAQDSQTPVVGVYFLCQKQWQQHQVGINQQFLILKALRQLQEKLQGLGIPLIIIDAKDFSGISRQLKKLITHLKISDVYFNIEYPINERRRDKQLVDVFAGEVNFHRYVGDSLVAPWKIVNGQQEGYKVFSAFARSAHKQLDQSPIVLYPEPAPRHQNIDQELLAKLGNARIPVLSPTAEIVPDIGEHQVKLALNWFIENHVSEYQETRDYPELNGTSELSAALAIGVLSVRHCYQAAKEYSVQSTKTWINELVWRDFYRAVMWHYPHVCRGLPFNPVGGNIQWSCDMKALERWQQGKTGVPIIDAAMMQLVKFGWMHNRLRMIVASYLTKNLWIDWRLGESFFAKHLYDYDFASNNGGWQWCSSVGTDAAPYFRIFNPAAQQKKFDSKAQFIKRWLPQLADFKAADIHRFETHQLKDYFSPQVDLKVSRQLAIDNFKAAKLLSV